MLLRPVGWKRTLRYPSFISFYRQLPSMAQPLLSPSSVTGHIPAVVSQHTDNALGKAPKSQKVKKPKAEFESQYPLEVCCHFTL